MPGERSQVQDSPQGAVVALGTVQPAGASARVVGDRGQAGVGGQVIGGGERGQIPDRGQELGTEPGPHPGQAENHPGGPVAAKPGRDVDVELVDAGIKGKHLLGQALDQAGGDLFARQPSGLGADRGDSGVRDLLGGADAMAGQEPGQLVWRDRSDRGGPLVGGELASLPGEVGGSFQPRADRGQVLAQPVDRPGPVGDQIGSPAGGQAQLHHQLLGRTQPLQVAAHPGLIIDYPGVFGVGLAVVLLADIDADPDAIHSAPLCVAARLTRGRPASSSLTRRWLAHLNQQSETSSRAGRPLLSSRAQQAGKVTQPYRARRGVQQNLAERPRT